MAYKVNKNYFANIDTKEKAYLLGFIGADGYLNVQYNRLTIIVHKKDKSVLEFFKKQIESDHPISEYRDNYLKVSIQNKNISKDLQSLGIDNKKSSSLVFPNINNNLHISYILGIFDGDGSFSVSRNYGLFQILGTPNILENIQKIFLEYNIDSTIYNLYEHTKRLHVRKLENLKNIYKIFYLNNNFCLNRKKEKFNNYFKNKI